MRSSKYGAVGVDAEDMAWKTCEGGERERLKMADGKWSTNISSSKNQGIKSRVII